MFKRVKVKKVEKKKLAKKSLAFLIFRYYRDLCLKEYVVCLNYDFKRNVYDDGVIVDRLDIAYKFFNYLVKNECLPHKKNGQTSDQEVENDDSMAAA